MDAGILVGVLFAVLDHVFHTAHTTDVRRISKQSRAVWSPQEAKIIQSQGYNDQTPKILALGRFDLAGSRSSHHHQHSV
jgi:hypothetical protein